MQIEAHFIKTLTLNSNILLLTLPFSLVIFYFLHTIYLKQILHLVYPFKKCSQSNKNNRSIKLKRKLEFSGSLTMCGSNGKHYFSTFPIFFQCQNMFSWVYGVGMPFFFIFVFKLPKILTKTSLQTPSPF